MRPIAALFLAFVIGMLTLPLLALGDSAPDDDDSAAVEAVVDIPVDGVLEADQVPGVFSQMFELLEQGQYWPALSLLVMFGIYLLRMNASWMDKVPKQYIPWMAVAVSMAGFVASAVFSGTDPLVALSQGLAVGAGASGMWSLTAPARKKKQ